VFEEKRGNRELQQKTNQVPRLFENPIPYSLP